MNWGDNLTLMGAIRADRWVTLGTCWRAMTTATFDRWVKTHLAPQLRRGDVVLLDNLRAHKSATAQQLIQARGATIQFLPPYSYDLNPIEAAWGLTKKRIRKTRTPHHRRPATYRPRGPARRAAPSLSRVVSACWVRQFKWPPDLVMTLFPRAAMAMIATAII
jgi:transposase